MSDVTDIEVDVSDEEYCLMIENYIKANLSEPSVLGFKLRAEEVGVDCDEIAKAAGHAIFNEAFIDAVKLAIEETKQLKQQEENNAKL